MILGRTATQEAERQYGDPYPFHVPKETRPGEPLSRLLRSKGLRIAVGQTVMPEGWRPHPDDASIMEPGEGGDRSVALIHHYRGMIEWKRDLCVGSRTTG